MQTIHLDQLSTQTSLPVEGVGIWLPSEQISHFQIPLPTAPKRKWQELLPWMLEDKVLEPVENLHFSIISTTATDLEVMALRRSDMDACLEQAAKVEVSLKCAQPDFLALPWKKGEIVMAWRLSGDSRVLVVRTGESSGFAAPEALAEVLVQKELAARLEDKSADAPEDVNEGEDTGDTGKEEHEPEIDLSFEQDHNSLEDADDYEDEDDGSGIDLVACMPYEALPAFLQEKEVSYEPAPDWNAPMSSSLNLLSGDYGVKTESNIPESTDSQ